MKTFIYLSILVMSVFSCTRKMPAEASPIMRQDSFETTGNIPSPSTPSCLQQKIDSLKKEPVWNPPAEIYEYEYEGKKVYVMSANCCDQFTTIVDADCKYVCAPSGGFTGRGDGKCPDFFKVAKQLRLVWKDERVRK